MNKDLGRIEKFLDDAKVYFLATLDGDKPRVRPFGTSLLFEDKLYIQTGKVKEVSKQIEKNPNVEICAFLNGEWLRLCGKLVNDDRRTAKKAMLDKMPSLRSMYSEDDDNTQVLYFENGEATFASFTKKPEVIKF